ncbi:MAG: alpha/beta hydrolase, partial [Oscillospiraceae bacterium]|nr:alpha/beta hydrolase [Oscillospiraceae bacterium]
MNYFEKKASKLLSHAFSNVKRHYKIYRRLHNAANPYFKPIYHALDRKIMVRGREIPVRVFYPKSGPARKVLIFFHGGGWVTGNIDTYTHICVNMARQTKHTVVSVDYRLAPEHPFPAGLEDCYYAARELFLHFSPLTCRPCDITLIGDSAGGNLAAAVSLMAKDRGEFMPCRQILLYPSTYFDHGANSPFASIRENGTDYILTSERVQSYMELYVSEKADQCNPYVAPLLSEDLSGQPKTLIITAQFDPLRDEGEAYGEKLREFHNDVTVCRIEDALHGFL